jgi:hypothetical protein
MRQELFCGEYRHEFQDPDGPQLSVVTEDEYITISAYDDVESFLTLSSRQEEPFSFRVSGTRGSPEKWGLFARLLLELEEEECAIKFVSMMPKKAWDNTLFEGVGEMMHMVSKLKVVDYLFKKEKLPREMTSIVSHTALRHLDISRTNLKEIPDQLPPHLVSLTLFHNKITSIPRTILDLENLERLTIHDNPIKEAPSFLVLHPTLSEFSIDPRGFVPSQIKLEEPGVQSVEDVKWWEDIKDYFEYLETWELVVKSACKQEIPMPIFEEITDHIIQEGWLRE